METFRFVEDEYFSGNYKKALSLCKTCAEEGNTKCIRFMGWFYYTGNGNL